MVILKGGGVLISEVPLYRLLLLWLRAIAPSRFALSDLRSYGSYIEHSAVQGYLVHKKLPQDPRHRLRQGPRRARFLVSEVPLHRSFVNTVR